MRLQLYHSCPHREMRCKIIEAPGYCVALYFKPRDVQTGKQTKRQDDGVKKETRKTVLLEPAKCSTELALWKLS